MRMMRLQGGRDQLTKAGIEEICSPPCIGDNFQRRLRHHAHWRSD